MFIEIEKFIKIKKKEVCDIIKFSCFSRNYYDYGQFWIVNIMYIKHDILGKTVVNGKTIAGMSCKKCGNYNNILRFSNLMSKCILCKCNDLVIFD